MILIMANPTSLPGTPHQEEEAMIVCVCNNISDREIRQAVDLGVTSMEQLSSDLGVATCCGQCADCARQVLDAHLADTGIAGAVALRRVPQSA